ncbi:MAG: hypothetical protein QOI66_1422 [Myxococcales bacterium]|nr:hypothetical protein [Myxococcales bacterium]
MFFAASDGKTAVEILWDAPPECPSADSVRDYAQRLLGQPLDTPRAQHVSARAKVRRNEAGNWELRLVLTSNQHVAEETLVAKLCSSLADATGLKVALTTDPEAAARAMETAPGVEAPAPGAPAPPIEGERAARPPEPAARGGAQIGVRAEGAVDFRLLPAAAPGAALTVWLQRSRWRAELTGRGFWGGDARFQQPPAVGAHLQLFSGASRVCAVLPARAVSLPLCLGGELGFMRGEGFGAQQNATSHSLWGAVVVGPALELPVADAVSLWLGAEGVFSFLRPGFNVRNLGTLYTAPPVSLRIGAGFEVRFAR